jgi:hypothetical protein
MPLLSNGHPIPLIDDRGAAGLRQYQHADENYEKADQADGPHGLPPKKGVTGSRKEDLLGCVTQGGVFELPSAPIVLPRSHLDAIRAELGQRWLSGARNLYVYGRRLPLSGRPLTAMLQKRGSQRQRL